MREDLIPPRPLFGEVREVVALSFPIVVTLASHTIMQCVDALMLGRYGRNELAAVVPAGLVYFTLAAFLIGLIGCNNTFVSQSFGAGRTHECARYTIHAVYIALAAQVLVVPLILFASPLLALFGHETAVHKLETTYFRVRALQLAGTGMVVALSTFYQGTGRPLIPMLTGIAANALNVVGDFCLIFGEYGFPEWGIFGAGLTTTVATYVEVALLLICFLAPEIHRRFNTRTWNPFDLRKVRQLLRIGLWTGVNFFLDIGSWTLFVAWLMGRLGTDVLAGNGAASQIMRLSMMPAIGLNIGVAALVGKHVGMGDVAGAKRRAYTAMGIACAYMTLMGILFVIFRRNLIGLFSSNPDVLNAGSTILVYMALFQFIDAIGILSHGSLKGAGDTKFPAMVALITAWVFFLPAAWWFGRPEVYGIHGAWISAVIYIWIVDVILFWRFVGGKWQKMDIFK